MHSNYAFYFGATPDNIDQLSKLKDVEGMLWCKIICWFFNWKVIS